METGAGATTVGDGGREEESLFLLSPSILGVQGGLGRSPMVWQADETMSVVGVQVALSLVVGMGVGVGVGVGEEGEGGGEY